MPKEQEPPDSFKLKPQETTIVPPGETETEWTNFLMERFYSEFVDLFVMIGYSKESFHHMVVRTAQKAKKDWGKRPTKI